MNWIVKLFKGKKEDLLISVSQDSQSIDRIQELEVTKIKPDPYKIVMNDSRNRLSDLKIYVNFFRNNTLNSIYNQTELIHDVFNTNDGILLNDISSLNQQINTLTQTNIDLLTKISNLTNKLNATIPSNPL